MKGHYRGALILVQVALLAVLSAVVLTVWAQAPVPQIAAGSEPELSHPAEAVAGGTFTFAISSDPVGLDPSQVFDFLISNQIYETLLDLQPGGTLVIPGLAERWSVSPDGLTWTFQLRSGVKFHDGTDLDAAAVVYNFERWWDPAHPYHDGAFDYFEYMFGGFRGDPDCLLSGLTTIGADQVQMALTRPHSPMANTLAMDAFAIASPLAIQAGTLSTVPVGTGPFTFMSWLPYDQIRLVANTQY